MFEELYLLNESTEINQNWWTYSLEPLEYEYNFENFRMRTKTILKSVSKSLKISIYLVLWFPRDFSVVAFLF